MNENGKTVHKPDSMDAGNAALEQELRHKSTLFCAKLSTTNEHADDDALRQGIADIAARMLALTAALEGERSPIPALLSGSDEEDLPHSRLICTLKAIAPDLIRN
ncbi:hypothetical protein H4S14_000685 [Agrobacterium vitis]|nr:hypothetical protein [Agrobacterium vitis]MBE1436958.1 hypothetical protein [Agrobacterium vitis]